MRRLSILVLLFATFVSQAFAFRDIPKTSKTYPAIQNLVERKILEDKGFFRPDSSTPAILFWDILLQDAGFNPVSADFNTPLPENISEKHPLASVLREAIRRGFIDSNQKFIEFKPIKRIEAIKFLVKTKGILAPKRVSTKLKKLVSGIPPTAQYLNEVEAALASEILENKDLSPLRPYDPVSRRDFVRWIYNWHQNGELKNSELNPPAYKNPKEQKYPYQKRNNSAKPKSTPSIKIEQLFGSIPSQNEGNLDLQVFSEVFNQISRKYKFIDELDDEKKSAIVNAAIAEMVKGLDDKYSSYIEPEKAKTFIESLEGEFEGIGAYVEMIDNKFTITAPIVGSPAEKAGLKAGDTVTKVDNEDITKLNISEAINKVRGPTGTKVSLSILRKGRSMVITVTRGKIDIPPLNLKWKNSIPIIGIHQFSRDTGSKLREMLTSEVLLKKPRGIIFDLRNNPGGFLTSAVAVGEIFLDKDTKIFEVEYKTGKQIYTASRKGELLNFGKPIVFLQNKGSASASEILTAMIQDYNIGKIIGTTSLGKGTVQEVLSFSNGGNLKLTIAKWLSPKSRWINEKGVIPDTLVEDATAEQKTHKIDPQLNTAIQEILRKH